MTHEIFIVDELKTPKELDWEILNYLSHGSFGKIFNIKKKGCPEKYIIKIESLNNKTCKNEHYFYNKTRKLAGKCGILESFKFPAQIIINNTLHGSLILEKKTFNLAFFIDYLFNIEERILFGRPAKTHLPINENETSCSDNKNIDSSKYNPYIDPYFVRVYRDFCTVQKRNEFIKKLLNTFEFLNKIKISHRDVKPENIVFNEIHNPYLIDFGFSTSIKDSKMKIIDKTVVGTLEYMSPDSHVPIKSKRSDLVSFGYCLFKILEINNLPWFKEIRKDGKTSVELINTIKKYFHRNLNAFVSNNGLIEYFNCIYSKDYKSDPDFDKLKNITFY